MINTYHTSLPPPPVPPRPGMHQPVTGRTSPLLWFFSIVLVLQMVLTFGGFVYIFWKNSSMQKELLELHEYDNGSLACKKVLDKYMAVISKISQARATGKGAFLSGSVPFHDSPAMAHMVADRSPESPTSKTLKWNSGHSLLEKVTYLSKPGTLKILEPGNYYVYSQVTFTKLQLKGPLSQYIVRRRPNKEDEVLLRAYASLNRENQQFTSFQAGVFKLEKDEELLLNVTDVKLLNLEVTSTTFGLFML